MNESEKMYLCDEKKYILYHVSSDEECKEAENELLNLKADEKYKGYRMRIVKSLNDFKEKQFIFNEDLDDKIIEAMKVVMYMQFEDELRDKRIAEFRFNIGKDNKREFVLIFINGEMGAVKYIPELYNVVKGQFSANLEKEDSFYIDNVWAIKWFKNWFHKEFTDN